ncbi:folylpolyglutamate synthase/dihydrofolate synthase family protein [Persephonella sp. KM09-Lau-8]|uniref:bifunctional folylpolyglutamate synthase/dihydrofolate synthase n=1 Tax=Persephonella sp. KM09-Lau-8 TaxID=1158345 RepID=UPI0004982EE1|nr:folylpolyglutamate synthase/dihydrofolate synthase family protein [Persephonella sp. KM09-Lau-8]
MKLYKLFNKKVFNIEPGLERIKAALEEIGNPHQNYPSILISGTNGKGSTAAFLESILRHYSLKTGMFTSPHLVEENERWQTNRQNIPDDRLEEYIKQLKPVIEKHNLTYFEASTLLAFKYFSDEKIDIAVLEVGLGGRWDATNVVYPEVSVITNVSLDHTHLLGDTISKIASEKLGIARKDRPLVIGTEQLDLITQAIMKGIREIYHYPMGYTFKDKGNSIDYMFQDIVIKDVKPSLLGKRQFFNLSAAITAFILFARRNSIKIDIDLIKKAAENTYLPGRMQIISENPVIILDGAHNEEAIVETFREVSQLFPDKKIITIYSGMKDKEWKKILNLIRYKSAETIVTKIPVSRSITQEEIKDIEGVRFYPEIDKAIEKVRNTADKNSIILITGSLYLVGEVLKKFK